MVSGVPADFEACRAPELADRAGAPVLRSSFNPARDSSPEMLVARTHQILRVARRETAFPGHRLQEREDGHSARRRTIDDGDAAGREAVLQAFREEEPAPGTRSGGRRSPQPAIPCPRPPQKACSSSPTTFGTPPKRESDTRHGLLPDVAGSLHVEGPLRVDDPHAPLDGSASSVELGAPASKGHEGPFASPALRSARRLAVRATGRQCKRKSERTVTRDIPDRFVATCASDRLVDTRDLAILMVAFASGDRRRSKVGRLRFEQLQEEPPVPVDPADPDSTPLPYLVICLGRTRMTSADDEAKVFLVVAPVAVVKEWLQRAEIPKGPTFRAVDRLGSVGDRALTPQSINLILKRRCAAAGKPRGRFLTSHGRPWIASLTLGPARRRPCRPISRHSLTKLTSTNSGGDTSYLIEGDGKALALTGPGWSSSGW